jgi:hypothetical protein
VLINYIIFKIDGGRSGTQKPFLNVNKILLDSLCSGGFRVVLIIQSPKRYFESFEKGLSFNYLGHGGEDGLSVERIWEKK